MKGAHVYACVWIYVWGTRCGLFSESLQGGFCIIVGRLMGGERWLTCGFWGANFLNVGVKRHFKIVSHVFLYTSVSLHIKWL